MPGLRLRLSTELLQLPLTKKEEEKSTNVI
jgi:hypothetical protein